MEIKVGAKYLLRDGRIAEITEICLSKTYPIIGEIEGKVTDWTEKGRFISSDDEDSDADLVSEYVPEPAPFTMDTRATMAMHIAAAFVSGAGNRDLDASSLQIIVQDSAWMADALIAELAKGKTE